MSFEKPICSSLVAVLFLLSLASAASILETVKAKAAEKNLTRGDYGGDRTEVNNFPVNALPPLTYSPKNYTFYSTLVSFFQAWNFCRDMGLRLASIENYQDHEAYKEQYASYWGYETAHWIAATSVGASYHDKDMFYWITNDRPVGYISGFQNWFAGTAPDVVDICAATYLGSALWVTGSCYSVASIACEESQDV